MLIYAVAMIVLWEQYQLLEGGWWDRAILGGLLLFAVPNGVYLLYVSYRYARTGK